ncbi:MAG: hypothetical protein E7189_02025 [Erysipelotrichaceae bacterium]|nr:hypothetical protein [Erysipelotrichaceae bacterium]
MRKFLSDLLSSSDFVLETPRSLRFVSNVYKKKYTELYFQYNFEMKHITNTKSIIFDSELDEMEILRKNTGFVRSKYSDLDDPELYCKLIGKVFEYKSKKKIRGIIDAFAELNAEDQEYVLNKCIRMNIINS